MAGWLAGQAELSVGAVFDDDRPRRGSLLALAVAGADGRTVAAEAPAAVGLAEQLFAAGRPLSGHELKPLLVWQLSRRCTRRHLFVERLGSVPAATGLRIPR